jgi:putative endonuclease
MAQHLDRGKAAEDISAGYLASNGYRILHRNWRYYHKELDITAIKGSELVIVEVKSCFGEGTVTPEELLTNGKQRFITDAAEAYILKYGIELQARFDLIVVTFSEKEPQLEHIEAAFIPGVNW